MSARIKRGTAADDDADIVFRQPILKPLPLPLFSAGTEVHFAQIDCARARKDRIRAAAQVHHQFVVELCAERDESPVCRGYFPVRGDGEVQINERQLSHYLAGREMMDLASARASGINFFRFAMRTSSTGCVR